MYFRLLILIKIMISEIYIICQKRFNNKSAGTCYDNRVQICIYIFKLVISFLLALFKQLHISLQTTK